MYNSFTDFSKQTLGNKQTLLQQPHHVSVFCTGNNRKCEVFLIEFSNMHKTTRTLAVSKQTDMRGKMRHESSRNIYSNVALRLALKANVFKL